MARAWSQVPAELWGQLAQDANAQDQVELDYSIPPGTRQTVVHWPAEAEEPDRG